MLIFSPFLLLFLHLGIGSIPALLALTPISAFLIHGPRAPRLSQSLKLVFTFLLLWPLLVFYINFLAGYPASLESFIKSFTLYVTSLFSFSMVSSSRLLLSPSKTRSFGYTILLIQIILFSVVCYQSFVDPSFTPLGNLTLSSDQFISDLERGRYQSVEASAILGSFINRPIGFYYEPAWITKVALCLTFSMFIVGLKSPTLFRTFLFSLVFAIPTLVLSLSSTAIISLALIPIAIFGVSVLNYINTLRTTTRSLSLQLIGLIAIFTITLTVGTENLLSLTKLFQTSVEGTSGWFRLIAPWSVAFSSLSKYILAVPLGSLDYEIPNGAAVILAYFSVSSILFLYIIWCLGIKLYHIYDHLLDPLLPSPHFVDKKLLLVFYILYLLIIILSTGSVFTPFSFWLFALPIYSFKINILQLSNL